MVSGSGFKCSASATLQFTLDITSLNFVLVLHVYDREYFPFYINRGYVLLIKIYVFMKIRWSSKNNTIIPNNWLLKVSFLALNSRWMQGPIWIIIILLLCNVWLWRGSCVKIQTITNLLIAYPGSNKVVCMYIKVVYWACEEKSEEKN